MDRGAATWTASGLLRVHVRDRAGIRFRLASRDPRNRPGGRGKDLASGVLSGGVVSHPLLPPPSLGPVPARKRGRKGRLILDSLSPSGRDAER